MRHGLTIHFPQQSWATSGSPDTAEPVSDWPLFTIPNGNGLIPTQGVVQ